MADKSVEETKEEPVSANASKRSGKRLPRKRLILLVAILAVVVAVLWYGIDWWMVGRFIEKTDDAYVGGNVTACIRLRGGGTGQGQPVRSKRTTTYLQGD